MSNIVDALTRKQREATDAAYQRGRAEASNEWREVVEEQERFHARELREARQEGMREGYSSRVKDEADACQLLPFWSAVTMCRSGMVDLEFGPRKFLELTPDEARELADALSEAADEIPETIDYDAERKAAIEEAM